MIGLGTLSEQWFMRGPVKEGENPVALSLVDDQIPVYSFGN